MDNATFQRIKDLILKHQEIGILVGSNPGFDEMAAGLGLYLSIKQMNKTVSIACPTDPLVAVSSLVGINKVQKTLGGAGGDLTVSFPYEEGEIEKVSYTLDNGLLNIVVKAGEKGLSFDQNGVQFKRAGKLPSLLFFIGVPQMADTASVYQPQAGIAVEIVNIDNKSYNEKYGDIVVVDPKWSSVSEQVADFVTLLEPQIELDADTAQNLLNGIDYATEDFTNPRTSYLAFEVAGILMKKGATRQRAQTIGTNVHINTTPNSSTFFPPIPPAKSQPEPKAQPAVQQPVITSQQSVQSQTQSQHQAPPDWLTPKVYKGSTVL